jgi:glyoxylase-like metal-dependent hydrolase (beta-lactamase superfamily II)
VLLVGFPALALGTNCYVVAPEAGGPCLVVDPGVGVEETLGEVLREHRLEPHAVLLTHGHFDHTYSVTPVCSAAGAAAYIHGDDAYRLTDPLAMMNPAMIEMLEQQFGRKATWQEPDEVKTMSDGDVLSIAGLDITVDHAPGHTEGSVMFRLPHDEVPEICLSGDVLFAGSIGRTDLPGGDYTTLLRSIRDVLFSFPDETVVYPGHGEPTTIGHEKRTNPFLL